MTAVGSGGRVGAAAVVLGLSLLGPQAAGVATADDSEHSGQAPAAGSPSNPGAPTRGGAMGHRGVRSSTVKPAAATRTARAGVGAGTAPSPRRESPTARPDRTRASAAHPANHPVSPAATTPTAPNPSSTPALPAWSAAATGPPAATPSAPNGPAAAASAVQASTALGTCAACWGFTAPSITQAVTTVVNHLFNSAFDSLAGFPGGPAANFVEGALVLVRRSLFGLVPTGVSATQVGSGLGISVNSGSVAYFRNDNGTLEVAGDPGFTRAQKFVAASVSQVLASGNGGCAGLAVTSGTTNAGLATDGIDSLRFGSSAQFTGVVVAAGVAPLQISDAIRSQTAVILDAPVVLNRDTAIDAGDGSVSFGGTVDGTGWFGGQSLTVTALGSTVFAGDVGGNTPLGDLVTRGIAPLNVKQSPDSITIPLYYMPQAAKDGQFNIKYGIDVAFGDSPARRYLFDTGGNGFFAFNNPGYLDGAVLGTDSVDITYSDEQTYEGVVASSSNITIGTGKHSVSTSRPVLFSAVNTVVSPNGQAKPVTDPSIADGTLFGDFGAAFGIQNIGGQSGTAPGSFITSVLFQLPGKLSSGYLVQLGPIGNTPSMTVGITPELKAQFPYALKVNELGSGFYPGTTNPLLDQFGLNASYSATYNGVTKKIGGGQPFMTLVDSGATSTFIRIPDPTPDDFPYDDNGMLMPGATLNAAFTSADPSKRDFTWNLTAGINDSVNLVNYSTDTGAATTDANVNTGLNLFNGYDVMYDAADQTVYLRPNGGQATVSLQSVTTTGKQSYGQNAVLDGTYTVGRRGFAVAGVTNLAGNTVVNAGGGDVTFSGTVDGTAADEQSLQVNSRGTTTFVRAVGGLIPLSTVSTDAGGRTVTSTVETQGSQSYGDDVTLNGLYQSASGSIAVGGDTTLDGPTKVSAGGSSINFAGRVDSKEGRGFVLSLVSKGTTTFGQKIGSKNPLGGLNIEGGNATAAKSVTLDGSLPDTQGVGLFIGNGLTVTFTGGGSISNFDGPGVQFNGDSPNSTIEGFTITGNTGGGVDAVNGDLSGTTIKGNSITNNDSDGISLATGADTDAVTNLTIEGNTIADNSSNGITVNGKGSRGNEISQNSIHGNAALGIALTNLGNGNQPTPVLTSATIVGPAALQISGSVAGADGYKGPFTIEVFANPASDASNVQGRRFLDSFESTTNDFSQQVNGAVEPGEFVTVTATPITPLPNTSQFSAPALLA